jgi:hypothetical protein
MSFDILIWLALLVGALFLMMRFGCGAHMDHADSHGGSNSDQTGGAGQGSFKSANGMSTSKTAHGVSNRNARRHGCC